MSWRGQHVVVFQRISRCWWCLRGATIGFLVPSPSRWVFTFSSLKSTSSRSVASLWSTLIFYFDISCAADCPNSWFGDLSRPSDEAAGRLCGSTLTCLHGHCCTYFDTTETERLSSASQKYTKTHVFQRWISTIFCEQYPRPQVTALLLNSTHKPLHSETTGSACLNR